MTAVSPRVDVQRDGVVATVMLNRQDELNALDRAARGKLIGALCEVAADDAVRAVVLTGHRPRVSASGRTSPPSTNSRTPTAP